VCAHGEAKEFVRVFADEAENVFPEMAIKQEM
jgi:hypothetical protein